MEEELFIALFSIAFIIVGLYKWESNTILSKKGIRTEGIIFKNISKSASDNLYYPVVRFKTQDKTWITQELESGYYPPKDEGIKLKIIYDPENPYNIIEDSFFQTKILPGIFIAIGATGFVWGMVTYLEITF